MKACPACKAPIRKNSAVYRDPNHGLCEYNDHGLRCGKTGSIALHTGEGGPWYCSEHALGLRGIKKITNGPQNIKSHLKSFHETEDEAAAERAAIQAEAQG